MKDIIFPKIIFVVGGAGAGKSTLSGEIKKVHSAYNIISDLQELRELLNSKQESIVQSGAICLCPPHVLSLPLGGFDIVNPLVWDYVLDATARKIQSNSKYVFEFARGSDARHLTTLGIREEELYKHCFEIILSALLGISTDDMLIIHVFSSFKSRLRRNDRRRQKNNHFVATKVMREVYLKDVFNFTPASESNRGYLECNNGRIMVFSIDNSQELLSMEIKKEFGKKLQEAFEYHTVEKGK